VTTARFSNPKCFQEKFHSIKRVKCQKIKKRRRGIFLFFVFLFQSHILDWLKAFGKVHYFFFFLTFSFGKLNPWSSTVFVNSSQILMSTECAFSEPSILGVSDHTLRGYIDGSLSLSLFCVYAATLSTSAQPRNSTLIITAKKTWPFMMFYLLR